MSKFVTPSYRYHKARNQAIVVLNGKTFYLGYYGSAESRRLYDQLVAEWLANGRRLPTQHRQTEITISELILAYWEFANGYYLKDGEPTNELWWIKLAMRPLRKLYGPTPAQEFGPLKLKAVREELLASDRSRTSVNGYVNRIKRMFRWATENELVPPGVYDALQAVAGLRRGRCGARESAGVRPVIDEHVDAIRPFVSEEVWAMAQLQRLSGMRSGEVTIMRACDIDMGVEIWEYRPESHKTAHHGHERVVELGKGAQDVLRPFLTTDVEAFLFSPANAARRRLADTNARILVLRPNRNDKPTPIGSRRRKPGQRYTTASYRRAIARGCERAGIPKWHPHQLRHSYATAIRREFGLEAAQVALGHRRADVTQIYAERNRELARSIAREVG